MSSARSGNKYTVILIAAVVVALILMVGSSRLDSFTTWLYVALSPLFVAAGVYFGNPQQLTSRAFYSKLNKPVRLLIPVLAGAILLSMGLLMRYFPLHLTISPMNTFTLVWSLFLWPFLISLSKRLDDKYKKTAA